MSSSKKNKTDAVKRKLFQYSPHKVGLALDAIRKGMNVSAASKNFNVPRTTLRHKLSGEAPETSGHVGPQAVLGYEIENELVAWTKDCARSGFPINKDGLLDSVKKIVEEGNLKTPFINNRPSRSWFEAFMTRHPDLRQKHAEYINKARSLITEEKIRNWFQEVSSLLGEENLSILEDPSRVWNCDETSFFLAPKGGLVLAEKGLHVYDTSKNSDKENITTLFTVNALGEYAPPSTVYKYKRMNKDVVENAPDGWGVGKTEKGWMTGEAFYEFVGNVFLPYLKEKGTKLPIILFLDGHKSHLTMQLSKLCRENGIIVVALVANTTHMLQPLDVAVFYPLKQNWRKLVKKWRIDNDGKEITKYNLPSALHSLIMNETFANNIKAGFKTCGLYPFGPDFVNYKRIVKQNSDPKENNDVSTKITISESSYLAYLEGKIDPNLLKDFYVTFEMGKDWEGNKEASMLYETWLAFKNDHTAAKTRTNEEDPVRQDKNSTCDEPPACSSLISIEGEHEITVKGTSTRNDDNTCNVNNPTLKDDNTCEESNALSSRVISTCDQENMMNGTGTRSDDNTCNVNNPTLREENTSEEPSASSSRVISTSDKENTIKDTGTRSDDNTCKVNNPTLRDENTSEEPSASSSRVISSCGQEDNVNTIDIQYDDNTCNTLKYDKNIEDPSSSSSYHVTCDQENTALRTPKQKNKLDEYNLDTCNQKDDTVQNNEDENKNKKTIKYTARELVEKCVLYPGKVVPKQTRKAMYIPSIITSNQWVSIMEAAENEKKEKLLNKKKKQIVKERVTKRISFSDEDGEADSEKDSAISQAAEKKKVKLTNKKEAGKKIKAKKKKVSKETSSSEEDENIDYAESGESECIEGDTSSNDEDIIEVGAKLDNQPRNGSKQRKRKRSVTKDSSSDSELPLSKVANYISNEKWHKKLKNDCYVIVKYEGEYFPGKIEKSGIGQFEISTMVLSTGNTFRWPERPDKIWYPIRDIVEIISPPVKHNNRGFFKIAEMEKFLPDIYNM